MTMDTLLTTAPALSLLRQRSYTKPAPVQQAETQTPFKRMPASELLKALLGIRDRQKKIVAERVTVRMSVMTPQGKPAISLWLNGRDSLS